MAGNGFVQIALFCAAVTLLVRPFGYFMTCVFNGERTFLSLALRPLERAIYALSCVKENEEQDWQSYGFA
ncbi:MAG: potassium-transporting ATPase subunit KdpA, partial [Methylocella sp.]